MAEKQTPVSFDEWASAGGGVAPVKTGFGARMGDLGLSAVKSAIAVPEMAVGLADLATGGKAGKAAERLGFRPKEAKEFLESQKSDAAKDAQWRFDNAEGFTGKLGAAVENPSLIANAIVESAAPMLAGGVVGRGVSAIGAKGVSSSAGGVGPAIPGVLSRKFGESASGVAGAIGEGVVGAGSAAEQIRQQTADGELTGKQAALAGATGVATGLLGMGGKYAAGKMGVGDIDQAIVAGTTKVAGQAGKEAPGMLKRVGGGALAEGVLEELPQSLSEQALQNVALDKNWTEDLDAAAAMGLVTGGAMGAGMGVMSSPAARAPAPDGAAVTPPAAPPPTQPAPVAPPPVGPNFGMAKTTLDERALYAAGVNPPATLDTARLDGMLADTVATIFDADGVFAKFDFTGNEEARDGMRSEMDSLAATYGGKVTPENLYAVDGELAQQFDWYKAATPGARMKALQHLAKLPVQPDSDADLIAQEQAGGVRRTYDPRAGVAPESPLGLVHNVDGVPFEEPAKPFGQNFVMPERPSVAMGLDPALGGMTAAAALAVDSGASPAVTQGFGMRRMGETVDVEPITGAAGQIGTPRRLGETPIIDVEAREVKDQQAIAGQTPRVGMTPRIGFDSPTTGALNGPQANQTQQAEAQRQETPAAGVTQDRRSANLAMLKTRLLAGRNQNAQAGTSQAAMEQPAAFAEPLRPTGIPARGNATTAQTMPQLAQQQQAQPPKPAAQAPAALGRNGVPVAEGGKPFKTKAEADTARNLQPMMRVKRDGKGFVLVEKTAAQIAAQEKAARRNLGSVGAGGGPLSAHAFLASQGGLSKSAMADLGFDRNVRVGSKWLFTNTGLSLEGMTEALQQNGYVQGTEQNPAIEMVRRSANGQPQYTADGWDQIAQAEATARFEDHLAAQQDAMAEDEDFDPFSPDAIAGEFEGDDLAVAGYDAASPAGNGDFAAMLAATEAEGIDTEAILERAAQQTQDGTNADYQNRASALIAAARGQRVAVDRGTDTQQGRQDAQRQSAGDDRAGPGSQGAPGADGPAEGLTAPTRADIEAQQVRAEQTERKADADKRQRDEEERVRRERADIAKASVAAADTFELGQDPLQSLTGQQDIFGSKPEDQADFIPSPEAAQSTTSYTDGQVLQAADLLGYFDEVIANSEKGARVKNPRFHIGEVDAGTASEIATYIEGYDGKQRRLRVSGRTLKHVHESRPAIAREIVEQLPGMFSKPDEVLPDPRHVNKRALLVKERKAGDGQSKQKSYVATVEVEIEVEVSDGFIDIVTIMTAPDRSLREARNLKKSWSEGQQRTEQAVNSPHPLAPQEGANPAADFPDARPATQSVPPTAQPAQAEGITAADVTQATAEARAAITSAIDAMQVQQAQKIAAGVFPSMGLPRVLGKKAIKATITDKPLNLLAAASEFGAELSPETKAALQAEFEGRVEAGEVVAKPEPKKAETAKPASQTPAMDAHAALMDAVRTGKATPGQFKAGFEAVVAGVDAIKAELGTHTKADLLKMGGPYMRMRYASENKPEIIDALYREMLGEFLLGESLTYGMGKNSYRDAIAKRVETVDADKLAKYVAERKAAIEEAAARRVAAAQAVADPKTLDDFKAAVRAAMMDGKTRKEAYLTLTPEQRIRFDELDAESTREARETRKRSQKTQVQAAGQTTGGQIIATKHTRDGYDLFVVQLSDRLSKEDYSTVLASAKRMGGWYSAFRGNGATPGFQFKEKASAEAFLKLAGGDTTAAQDQAAQRRDAFEDDRSQTAAERLTEMADRLEAQADEELGRDRKANTARRARFAASAEAAASNVKALAKTMRNIATAIGDGKAKFLDAVRQKTQVEMLAGVVHTAKYNELVARFPEYADREKRKGEPPTIGTADFAEFPSFTAFRSDLATLARQMLEVDRTKKLGQQLMGVADDVTDAYLDFAKGNLLVVSQFGRGGAMADFSSKATAEAAIRRSGLVGKAIVLPIKRGENRVILSPSEAMNRGVWKGDGDKRITLTKDAGMELVQAIGRKGNQSNGLKVPWQFETAADRLKALSRMGIETPAEFRSAVREFISLRVQAQEADRVKAMERAMVGRKADGLDFFPTPAEVADQMVETAGIEPDMAVLEPSAGMGHLADRIRAAGAEPDVVELSGDRRELLEEKGFTVVGTDFMQLKPRSFFTYGDVFRAPDGKEGVMRGQGGMGSDRVRLVNDTGNILGYYNRDELTGVRHGGTESGYDRIIMNPPFGDRRDAEHVRHAYSLLKPGGRLVAIMGEGVFFGKDKKAEDFREWLDTLGGTSEKLPEGSFMDPSLPVTTGVNARMVVVEKPAGSVSVFSAVRKAASSQPKLSQNAVVQAVASALNRVPGGPNIRVVANPGEIDLAVPDAVIPKGVTLPDGSVFVFSDYAESSVDVIATVFHELFHRGSKVRFTSNPDYITAMLEIAAADDFVQKEVDAWKGTPDGRAKWSEFGEKGEMSGERLANFEALAVEEALASMAEKVGQGELRQPQTAFKQLARFLARLANRWGMTRLALWLNTRSQADTERFILDIIGMSGGQAKINTNAVLLRASTAPAPANVEAFSVKGQQTEDDLPAASRRARPVFSRAAQGQASSVVQGIVDSITARWANAPKVVVAFDMDDPAIPERVRQEDQRQRSGGATGTPEGFYYKGTVYLMSSKLADPRDVVRVLFHEALGHYGLRGVFGKELKPLLQQIVTMRRAQIEAKMKEYGLRGVSNVDRLVAAEEVLAEMAQDSPQIGFVRRAIATIKAWLRKHVPGFGKMMLTDDEIISRFILPARNFVLNGGPNGGPGGGVRFQAVDAGTGEQYTGAHVSTQPTADEKNRVSKLGAAVAKFLNTSEPASGPAYRAVSLPDAADLQSIGSAFGKRVVGFGLNPVLVGKKSPFSTAGGVSLPSMPDTVFINIKGNRPHISVLGHELAHTMRREAPALYDELVGAIRPYIKQTEYGLGFSKEPVARDLTNPDAIREEFIGEVISDGFTEPTFWNAIGEKSPALLSRVVGAVGSLIDKVRRVFGPQQRTKKYLTDFDRVMEIAGDAMARYKADAPEDTPVFSRSVGEALTAGVNNVNGFDVAGATGDRLAHYRGMGMQVLGRRQIVDLYGDMLPELKQYDTLVQRMDADKNESGAEADALVSDWAKLDERAGFGVGLARNPGMERKLAELMHDATLAQIDPAKPLQKGDDPSAHKALAAKFEALSPKAQEVYRTARDMYNNHFKKVQSAIQDRIRRSGMDETSKAKMIAKMDADLFNKLKGVYFPLARFGKYVVVSKNAAGETVSVSRAETLAEANNMRREVVKNSPPGVTVSRVYKDAEFNASRDAVGKGFVSELMTMLQGQGVGEDVLDSVGQLYLSSLPDLSWAKHGIHRKGTPGFSQDARRAFAQNMFHGARHLAKLRYSDQLADKLMDMEERVKDRRDDEGFDPIKAQQVVDEMNARHESLMNPKTSSLSTALTSVGFVWFLGISPASAMVNLSQTALVAYPVMAAKWGFQKAGTALLSASAEVVRAGNDLGRVLKGDELAAFQKAVDDGTIDVTQAHDLAGVAQGEDERVAMAMRPVMRAASFMFHHAEKFNRQATFIAAYRLAKESGADAELAFEQAKKATYDGHFDYSASNRPRLMQGNWQKVLFLFKQYGQNMVYTLTRQAYLSMKGMTPEQRTEARKQLGGLLAMHAMAAGALGLPLVGVLLSAASMMGGGDDEPWDAEVALKNMMADAMGPKAAEVMAHGLSRLTPWDLSGRVALNKLILPDIQEGVEGQPLWEKMVTAAAGPVAGIGQGLFKGVSEMGQGQYRRGLESMLPVALKNPVKAIRFADEGAVDKTGVVIKDDVGVAGVIGQALGWRPSEVALATEGKSAIYQADKALTERRSNLVRVYAMARMSDDTEGVQDALEQVRRFNEKNPNRRITIPQLMQSVRNRQRRIDEAQQGVYLPKNRRDVVEAGRFALVE